MTAQGSLNDPGAKIRGRRAPPPPLPICLLALRILTGVSYLHQVGNRHKQPAARSYLCLDPVRRKEVFQHLSSAGLMSPDGSRSSPSTATPAEWPPSRDPPPPERPPSRDPPPGVAPVPGPIPPERAPSRDSSEPPSDQRLLPPGVVPGGGQ
ncbi:unnamed protein product [Gadus morhua 'NCC']